MSSTEKLINIGKHLSVKCYTIGGLAKLSGKSAITLRKWEEKGWLPVANFRMPRKVIAGEERDGERLYTADFASQYSDQIKRVARGETINNEVIRQLSILFKEELKKYTL